MTARSKRLLSFSLIILLFGGALLAWTNRWDIHDFLRLRGYTPPPRVVQLAKDTTMTEDTARLFYVYHPSLEDKESFFTKCSNAELTIVLGCFNPQTGIFISNITDKRLEGILQVTAAHETLHAAYGRLPEGEKNRVNRLLDQAFDSLANDRIRANIEEYRNHGADIHNELHSILGTEVKDLPDELEQYYSQYFEDRSKIVDFCEQYETAFTALEKLVEQYDKQLASLQKQIDNLLGSLKNQEREISREEARLNSLRSQNRVEEYNAGVDNYNSMIRKYNADVSRVRSLIDQYNSLVNKRNEIALEENELYNIIDSRPQTK